MPTELPHRRRVLRQIKLTEISGVDRPAQEGALVTIMKRADPDERSKENDMNHIDELEGQILDLEAQVEHFAKQLGAGHSPATPITKSGYGDAFDALVQDEIARGCPPNIAGQRVILKHGTRPDAARIQKSQGNAADFMHEVDRTMLAKRCTRQSAMQEVRKCHPDLYSQFQEI